MGYCSKFWVTKFGIIKFQNNSMSYGLCKLLYLSWGGIRRIAPLLHHSDNKFPLAY